MVGARNPRAPFPTTHNGSPHPSPARMESTVCEMIRVALHTVQPREAEQERSNDTGRRTGGGCGRMIDTRPGIPLLLSGLLLYQAYNSKGVSSICTSAGEGLREVNMSYPIDLAHLNGAHAVEVDNIRPRLNQVRQRGSSTKVRGSRHQKHDGATKNN